MLDSARSLQNAKDQTGKPKDQYQILKEEVAQKTDKLNRYSKHLEILNQASVIINSIRDVPTILRTVTQAALELWESDGGAAGIVDDGQLLFRDWYWKGQHNSRQIRCNILRDLNNMSNFMEVLKSGNNRDGPFQFSIPGNVEIKKCLAVPIHDRQLKVQACLLLFNSDNSFSGENVIENPLPALISSAGTALDNTRSIMELRDKELALQSSLQEKNLLLKEIHHRVKNNLQAIVGLLEAHLGAIESPRDKKVFQKGQSLAMSMAMIHELLYSTEDFAKVDFGENTRKLVDQAFKFYPDLAKRVQITFDLEELFLNTDTAIPLSLIINELISNALIHAFPDGRSGNISISMKPVGRRGFLMEIADDGIGMPNTSDVSSRKTLGLSLINSLMDNLHGTMKVKVNGGTRYIIRFKEYFECDDLELG